MPQLNFSSRSNYIGFFYCSWSGPDQDSLKISPVSSCDRICLFKDWCVASGRHLSDSQLLIKGSYTVSHLVIATDPLRLQTRCILASCVLTHHSSHVNLIHSLWISWKRKGGKQALDRTTLHYKAGEANAFSWQGTNKHKEICSIT